MLVVASACVCFEPFSALFFYHQHHPHDCDCCALSCSLIGARQASTLSTPSSLSSANRYDELVGRAARLAMGRRSRVRRSVAPMRPVDEVRLSLRVCVCLLVRFAFCGSAVFVFHCLFADSLLVCLARVVNQATSRGRYAFLSICWRLWFYASKQCCLERFAFFFFFFFELANFRACCCGHEMAFQTWRVCGKSHVRLQRASSTFTTTELKEMAPRTTLLHFRFFDHIFCPFNRNFSRLSFPRKVKLHILVALRLG